MIVNLKNQIFQIDPDVRFSEVNNVPRGTWTKIWYRYKWLGYSRGECLEYYIIFTKGKRIGAKSFNRWITRSELYLLAQEAIKLKMQDVHISHFGELKEGLFKYLKQ